MWEVICASKQSDGVHLAAESVASLTEPEPQDHGVSLTDRNITLHISGALSFTSDTQNRSRLQDHSITMSL